MIGQFADPLYFELDRVASFQEAAHFEAAAAAVRAGFGNRPRAGAKKFSRVQSLVLGNVGDQFFKRPAHAVGVPVGNFFSIDARSHRQIIRIGNFIGRDEDGTDRIASVKIFSFCGTEPPAHFSFLNVARGKIVEDGVAADKIAGNLFGNVAALPAQENAEFEFPIERFGVARDRDTGPVADHIHAVALVVDGPFVPWPGHPVSQRGLAAERLVHHSIQ